MRTIILADMNAFFASVHQAVDPRLRGKPVIVCGDPAMRRGVVLAASYPAKKFGVKTGMTVNEARHNCPQGILVRPDHRLYKDFSLRVVSILKDYSDLCEVFSIDECFLDVTGCKKLFGDGPTIARSIQRQLKEEVGISCSIGVGSSKVVAKTAADLQKPDGLTVITNEDIPQKYWPLPVEKMFGVGPRTRSVLNYRFRINTIGDLASCSVNELQQHFGVVGSTLWCNARGEDSSPVDPHSLDESKSIGHQVTLPKDCCKKENIDTVLLELADGVCQRARGKGYRGKTVGLTIRGADFSGLNRMVTIGKHTNLPNEVFAAVKKLFERHWPDQKPVRLLGVTMGQLVKTNQCQLELFSSRSRDQALVAAVDLVQQRFGKNSLFRAVSLTEGSLFKKP